MYWIGYLLIIVGFILAGVIGPVLPEKNRVSKNTLYFIGFVLVILGGYVGITNATPT